jgi:hypothetical protein
MTAPPNFIAQQYFSAISIALRSHSRKEKLGAPFKKWRYFNFFPLFKFFERLKWCECIIVQLERVCSGSAAHEMWRLSGTLFTSDGH